MSNKSLELLFESNYRGWVNFGTNYQEWQNPFDIVYSSKSNKVYHIEYLSNYANNTTTKKRILLKSIDGCDYNEYTKKMKNMTKEQAMDIYCTHKNCNHYS